MNESRDTQYRRVHESLLADIRRKRWNYSERLPSETQLAEEMGVSRSTVSRVMARLRYSGLVVGPPGGAACVTEEPMWTMGFELFDAAARIRRMNRERGFISPD